MLDAKPYTFDRVMRMAFSAALIWGLVSLLGHLSGVLVPFAVALLLAYLMNPLVTLVQKKIKNRPLAVCISLLAVVLAFVGLAAWAVPMIVSEMSTMGELLSKFASNSELAQQAADRLPPDIWAALKRFFARDDIQEFFASDNFLQLAQKAGKTLLPGVLGAIKGTANVLMAVVGLVVILLYMIFLLMDFQSVSTDWITLFPEQHREPVALFVSDFEAAMNRYFRAQALLAAIAGVLFAIGFSIIGLPMAILLGLFLGLLNMVPYLQTVGFIPALILSLMHSLQSGTDFSTIILMVVGVFAVVQVIQDGLLTPRIMGQAMGLSPWLIMLSLSVWGQLLGMLGLLIALPMTCLCLAYYRRAVPVAAGAAVEE